MLVCLEENTSTNEIPKRVREEIRLRALLTYRSHIDEEEKAQKDLSPFRNDRSPEVDMLD